MPVATTIAILRHDLYDVDRALSATLTYGTVSAVLVLLFTVVSFIIGLVLGNQSVPAAAGATALAAVVLAQLRTRVQRGVDRRIYPTRRAALEAVDELRAASNAGHRHPEQLERVLRTALRDPQLRVGFLIPGSNGFVDAQGQPLHAEGMATPVELRAQQIGLLMSPGTTSRQLLREIAKASALLVEMVRLRLEVSAALREAESSRARLLRTGYDERRRLERDLHDGAQQRLVALGMSLRLAQRHLDPNATGATSLNKLLDHSVEELSIAVAELRQIAHGLRPSCLDDGLHPALSLLAESIRYRSTSTSPPPARYPTTPPPPPTTWSAKQSPTLSNTPTRPASVSASSNATANCTAASKTTAAAVPPSGPARAWPESLIE